MAFSATNLYNQNSRPPGFAKYTYKSDTDLRATVEAVGYFNNSDDNQNFAVDDEIRVIGDEGGYTLYVASISSGAVTTTDVRTGSPLLVAGGAALTLTRNLHDGKTVVFDTAAGTILTLPLATGTGMRLRCVVSVLATTNAHVVNAAGSDIFQGSCGIVDTDTSDATIQFAALVGDGFVTVTMNRTTSGLAAPGDWVEFEDIIAGVWAVRGVILANGTVITPFS